MQVKDGRATPVLLDFGMTVKLTDTQRMGYAQLAFAAQQMDIQRLQEAIVALGVKNNQQEKDPSRDLDFWRFFLRDTGGRDEARKDTKDFFARKVRERNDDKAKGEEARKVQSLPTSFVFFWRVIGLLRGLCATLNVRVPYMDILAARAKLAIAMCVPSPQRALTLSPPLESLPAALPQLHNRLAQLLVRLCGEGSISAGVQVCVQRSSATLAESCAGFRGVVDPRGLRVDLLMPLLELSALLPVLGVHQLVASGRTSYDAPLQHGWPGCEAAARGGYTVGDALGHHVPLDGTMMWRQPVSELCSLASQYKKVATTSLVKPPPPTVGGFTGISAAHDTAPPPKSSSTAHATLLAGIIEGVCGPPYSTALQERLLEPLGLTGLLYGAGLPEAMHAEVPSVTSGFGAQLQRFASMRQAGESGGGGLGGGEGGGVNGADAGADGVNGANGANGANGVNGANGANGEDGAVSGTNGANGSHGANGAAVDVGSAADTATRGVNVKEGKEEEESKEQEAIKGGVAGAASQFAHEVPLNLGMVNASDTRAGCVPGLAAFGSARSVCALLGAAARGETGALSSLSVGCGVETSMLYGDRVWARGVQRYDCTGGTESHVLGLHSFAGSFAFLCPRSGVTVAILLNDGQLDFSATRSILDVLSEELGIGQIDYLGGGLF